MIKRRILLRIFQLLLTVSGAVTVVFFASRLIPADPARIMAGPAANEDSIEAVRDEYGLNETAAVQYADYIKRLFHGDLGRSIHNGRSVLQELSQRIPSSLELVLSAVILSFLISTMLALFSVKNPGGPADRFSDFLVFAGTAVPPFLTGIILLLVFYSLIHLAPPPLGRIDRQIAFTPVTGLLVLDGLMTGRFDVVFSALSHLVLPSVTLGFSLFPQLLRLVKAGTLKAVSHPAVVAAKAAGVSGYRYWIFYVFSLTAVPAVTLAAGAFGYLIGGSIIVEEVFGWNGLGSLAVSAVVRGDYNVIQGIVLVTSAAYAAAYFFGDLVSWMIDPRLIEESHA